MTPDLEAVRANRPVVISVVVAATAVTACALVAIAVMLGWVGPRAAPAPALPEGATLSPGESVVTTPAQAPQAPPKASERPAPSSTAPARPAPARPDYGPPPPPDPRRSKQ